MFATTGNERGSFGPRLRDHACCIIAIAVQRDLETEQGRKIGHLLFSMLFPYARRLSGSARRRIDAKNSANGSNASRMPRDSFELARSTDLLVIGSVSKVSAS